MCGCVPVSARINSTANDDEECSRPGRMRTLLFRLAVNSLRHDRTRSLLSILTVAIEMTMILSVVGIEYGIALHPGLIQTQVAVLVLGSFLLIAVVSFLFGIFETYTATLERAHDIGILKTFGASSTQIMNLLAHEGLMIAVLGTLLGIATTYFVRWLIAVLLSTFLSVEVVYAWWPIAGTVVTFWAVLGAALAFRKIHAEDIVRLLSEQK
jgi:FtsX-like permease family